MSVLVAAVGIRRVGTGVRDSHLQDGGFVVRAGQQDQVVLKWKSGDGNQTPSDLVPLASPGHGVGLRLTSRIPSASITTVQVPGFRTNGSTKLFWGTLTNFGSALGAKTICLDCSEPGERKKGISDACQAS